ncbi:MAG: hypothetical protein QM796_01045 [Chthoniobacteraceae bacterium]
MKITTKLALIVATLATFGTTAAFADSPELQNRLALNRQLAASNQSPTTVALYATRHGLGQRAMESQCMKPQVQLRYDAHGQLHVESVACNQ